MIEQPDGVSRILCCDQIHFLECPQYTVCNILKIADRGGTQIECAGFYVVPWEFLPLRFYTGDYETGTNVMRCTGFAIACI